MNELKTEKIATLRKMAKEQGVEGFEDMKRPELLAALGEPEEEETLDSESEGEAKEKEELPEKEATLTAESTPTDLPPAPMGSKAHAMRDFLHAEQKVRVFIPLANGEKSGVTQSVNLNGYPMYIRKGEYVDVPKSVADVLEIKMKHKMSVEDHADRIGGDRPVKMTTFGG